MSFGELVAAGMLLLAQTNPDLHAEAQLVSIRQADPTSMPGHAGFFVFSNPENIWVDPEHAYNPRLMRSILAHLLVHHRDWREGRLTEKTCGNDYVQAELRALRAEREWLPMHDLVMLNYVRGNGYDTPCQEAA